jgi:hypothetical protein
MTATLFTWPTKDDYDLAMLNKAQQVHDKDLRSGELADDPMDFLGIRRYGGANLYVSLYRVGNWMARCFCSGPAGKPPDDIRERYQHISKFCQDHHDKVSALLGVYYIEDGITVDYINKETDGFEKTALLPLIKMEFLDKAPSLGGFVAENHAWPQVMEQLSEAWLCMIRELEAAQMAHGDLDLTNVKVVQQDSTKLTLKLIDYDNIWIPALSGRKQTELGHVPFQHPQLIRTNSRLYDATMDRFSALVMYISLKALVVRPQLYKTWGADEVDRLLLSKVDYESETHPNETDYYTRRIAQLRDTIPDLIPYIDELRRALHEGCMPRSLDSIAGPGLSPNAGPQTAPVSPVGQPASGTAMVMYHFDRSQPASEPLIQPRSNEALQRPAAAAPRPTRVLHPGRLQQTLYPKSHPAQPSRQPVVHPAPKEGKPRVPRPSPVRSSMQYLRRHRLHTQIGALILLIIIAIVLCSLLFSHQPLFHVHLILLDRIVFVEAVCNYAILL